MKKAVKAAKKATKQTSGNKQAGNKPEYGEPKFPYTTEPKALGRLLAEIPKRPKPSKMTFDTLKSWGVSNNTNARSAIGVLRKLGLLSATNEPIDAYVEFMKTGVGPSQLGARIKETYRTLFENSHAPQNESNEELKKLFHIHSGGGEDALRLQVQTFKTLSEHASFAEAGNPSSARTVDQSSGVSDQDSMHSNLPPVQIALHIHLPENKTTRDYESIIQDIAKYIYRNNVD